MSAMVGQQNKTKQKEIKNVNKSSKDEPKTDHVQAGTGVTQFQQ